MFVIYAEGKQQAVKVSDARKLLKVARPTKEKASPETELEQFNLDDEDANKRLTAFNSAISQYQSMAKLTRDKHVVVKVREIMSSPVFFGDDQMSLFEMWEIMRLNQIFHLPILNSKKQLVGLCSSRCIFKALVATGGGLDALKKIVTKDVMVQKVVTTHVNNDIRNVALVMDEYKIGCVVILSESEAVQGIVTSSDLIKRLSQMPPIELYA